MTLNVHYLELFYYVARHGGIMNAVRRMPYGIQQPAVSGQILKLEESLGVRLFHRRPFQLTPEGERLYHYCEPFFGHLEELATNVRGEGAQRLRLASSESVLRNHLPPLLANFQKRFPLARVTLAESNQISAEQSLLRNELDIALTEIGPPPGSGIHHELLLQIPIVLILQKYKGMPDHATGILKSKDRPPLIAFSTSEAITKIFTDELNRRSLHWPVSLEVSSLELIQTYVNHGFGVGLSVDLPGRLLPKDLVVLPLEHFPLLKIGALWRGKLPPLQSAFLDLVRQEAAKIQTATA